MNTFNWKLKYYKMRRKILLLFEHIYCLIFVQLFLPLFLCWRGDLLYSLNNTLNTLYSFFSIVFIVHWILKRSSNQCMHMIHACRLYIGRRNVIYHNNFLLFTIYTKICTDSTLYFTELTSIFIRCFCIFIFVLYDFIQSFRIKLTFFYYIFSYCLGFK